MQNPFAPGVGGVLSADIAVPEHEAELRFYARILTTGGSPLWRKDLMNNRGMPIIGLGKRMPEYKALPMQWMPHLQVADVGACASRAVELGGSELMHGRDAEGRSQWAVLTDPSGEAFGLVPVIEAELAVVEGTGRISSLTLVAADVPATSLFYQEVVGWSAAQGADGIFRIVRPDGGTSAEILVSGDGAQGVPSVWLIGLPVGDLDESLRRTGEGGGEVVWRSVPTDRAVVRDPVGVCLVIEGR
ncbi:MAG: hypothetical protein JJ896_01085 [Rhodothermales bacterium]|nr:hypothetical protein [Rhodothermales bacterium]MBO6778222.1 hypothetical protein [Rhodothermales bacterium]